MVTGSPDEGCACTYKGMWWAGDMAGTSLVFWLLVLGMCFRGDMAQLHWKMGLSFITPQKLSSLSGHALGLADCVLIYSFGDTSAISICEKADPWSPFWGGLLGLRSSSGQGYAAWWCYRLQGVVHYWEKGHQACCHPKHDPCCCGQVTSCTRALSLNVKTSLVLCRCTLKVIKERIIELDSKGSQDHHLDT